MTPPVLVWTPPRRGNVSGVFRPVPKTVSCEPPGRQRRQSQQGRIGCQLRRYAENNSHSLFEHDLRANASRLSQGKPVSTFPDHAVGTAPALKRGHAGAASLGGFCSRLGIGGFLTGSKRVDVSERAEFLALANCSRLSAAGQTNQGSVVIVSSRHSRMGFFHDNCQGQDFEHRPVVGFSREIGVFRRPFQKGSDRDRTEQPRMARREVARVHPRRAATEQADPTGPGRAGADLPANA